MQKCVKGGIILKIFLNQNVNKNIPCWRIKNNNDNKVTKMQMLEC